MLGAASIIEEDQTPEKRVSRDSMNEIQKTDEKPFEQALDDDTDSRTNTPIFSSSKAKAN